MYEIVNEKSSFHHPLKRFSGYSGTEHPSFKNKDYETILQEITSLHSLVKEGYYFLFQDIVEHNGKALYPLTEKYHEDLTFKDISYLYFNKIKSNAKNLLKHLVLAKVINSPYIGLLREKILDLAEQNLFDSTWAETAYAVKCSYSTTHLFVFLLERYSYRTIQGWFQDTEKIKGELVEHQRLSLKYKINRDVPPEPRYIGVGYKDKPASTPEHKKLVNIHDSRSNVEKLDSIQLFGMSNTFCDITTLRDLELISEELKIKIKEFNEEEKNYEQYCEEIRKERINSRRAIQPTEGPGRGTISENREAPVENYKYPGGNYITPSRENQKVESFEEFREKLRKQKEKFYRTYRKSTVVSDKRRTSAEVDDIYSVAHLLKVGWRVIPKKERPV